MKNQKIITKTLKRRALKGLITKTHGKPFEVSFIKKDGSKRRMIAKTEVTEGLKGGKSTLEKHKEYYVVYDVEKEAFRAVNLNTVYKLRIDSTIYNIKD